MKPEEEKEEKINSSNELRSILDIDNPFINNLFNIANSLNDDYNEDNDNLHINDNDKDNISLNNALPVSFLKEEIHHRLSDGIDAAAYMGMKPPTFELNEITAVKKVIYNTDEYARTVEFPFPIHIPKSSRTSEDYFNMIKELVKHLNEYREILQILSNKNILVKGHFGTNNLSFSLSDEELDKFMTCLENLNKSE